MPVIRSTARMLIPSVRHAMMWITVGDLLDAALATQPITPTETPAKRRSRFKVIQGDLFD